MMELDMAAKEARNYSGTADDAKHCNKDAGVLYKQHLGVGPGPLGLHLTKSASLVNMIQMALHDQASKEKGRNTRCNGYCGVLNRTSMTKAIPCSKFCASYLRIGTWEWKPRYDGDLVAKFYYRNGKLIWEILRRGLKSKIEIDWKTISALHVNCQANEPGTLDIMLSQVPIFFKETDTQPGMSTKWQRTLDFTDGQASLHRKHFLQCGPGILDEHIVKLLSSNPRLRSLIQKNTVNQRNPLFEQLHLGRKVVVSSGSIQNYNYPQFKQQQFREPVSISNERNTVGTNYNEPQVPLSNKNPRPPSGDIHVHRDLLTCNNISSSQTPPQAQLETFNGRMHNNTAHYMINPSKPPRRDLVTSIGASARNIASPEDVRNFIKETPPTINQPINSGIPFIYTDDSLNQNTRDLISVSNYAFNDPRNLQSSDDGRCTETLLEEISHDLLSDTYETDAVDEMLIVSEINSFSSSLLLQDPAPATVHAASDPPVNIEAEAPSQELDVAAPGSRSGDYSGGEGGNGLPPPTHMQSVPWEDEPVWDMDMDMDFLLDFPPFSP